MSLPAPPSPHASRIELANLDGRAQLVRDGRLIDVGTRSHGQLPTDPMDVIADWDAFCAWAEQQAGNDDDPPLDPARLAAPVPRPPQVFAIGLNYRPHADEAQLPLPTSPMVFTKFPSCISAPFAEIELTGDAVDWEVELVAVIGTGGHRITAGKAAGHIAGYCVGQDISDRQQQFTDTPAQFSLGKSAPGYGPIGPTLVAARSLAQPLDLALSCEVSGESMQHGRTSEMVFSVPEVVEYLSARCTLQPGDLIFTGTPSGVGVGRTPPRFLRDGDTIRSSIEGCGTLSNRCVSTA